MPPEHKGTDTFYTDRLRRYPDNPLLVHEAENPEGEILEVGGEKEWVAERSSITRSAMAS